MYILNFEPRVTSYSRLLATGLLPLEAMKVIVSILPGRNLTCFTKCSVINNTYIWSLPQVPGTELLKPLEFPES